MKILVHHHKYGDEFYDATDELWAFGQLFESLDEFDAYVDIEEGGTDQEKLTYAKAKAGDLKAAKWLCVQRDRAGAEYEEFVMIEVQPNPASPVLLEAAKATLAALDEMRFDDASYPSAHKTKVGHTVEPLRAAIERAEGKVKV